MRVRARFTKLGKVRFLSHRDVARVWERALRRAGLPIAYTEGFTPRPKVHFGLALSVGHESVAEFIDVDLDPALMEEPFDAERATALLSDAMPVGMDVVALEPVDRSEGSLQEFVTSCTWQFELLDVSVAAVAQRIEEVLAASELPVTRTRKGKGVSDDLRPNIISLRAIERDGTALLEAELGMKPRAVRPAELLGALDPTWDWKRICRLAQWMHHDGARHEPLPAPGPSTTRTKVRVS